MRPAAPLFQTPFGDFTLVRHPARREEQLLGWCHADTLLLEALQALDTRTEDVLVVNDSHGALGVPLQCAGLWTDSALAKIALHRNEEDNNRACTAVYWSTQTPPATAVTLMRIPKQLAYFEYQLATLANQMPEGSTLIVAGMDKHLSPHTASVLERYIGPTQRHRGQRKARAFTAIRDSRKVSATGNGTTYFCEELNASLSSGPNVFSAQTLDIGSRFLISQMATLQPVNRIIDLACGNGVLGLAAAVKGLSTQVEFIDESAMAIASARDNAEKLFAGRDIDARFHHSDGLRRFSGAPADLILCNPPFHLEHTVDEFIGRHLLRDCALHLNPGGHLCLVANRHLNYQDALKRQFDTVKVMASNAKFNILLARKA